MENKLMESYLDNIAEQVVDENKIVTYKSLSRSLGIHVNTAKQLLYTYLTKEKSRNSFPISATYLVAGKVVDGSFNIAIVNEADLKNSHSNFLEVTSEHIYSVQKSTNLKELKVLSSVNKESSNLKSSSLVIKCSKGVLKSRGEVKKKTESSEEVNKKVIKQALAPEGQTSVSEPQVEPQKVVEPQKTNETSTKCPKQTSPKGNSEKPGKKPVGNIASLFAKAAQKNAMKGEKSTAKDKVREVNEVEEVKLRSESGSSEKRNETKESLKKTKKTGSKRKRIQLLSDSEESDSNDEGTVDLEEEEEESPPPPVNFEDEKEPVDPTPRNKRKRRKVIDKTVMNEDGYLETRKEVVFETDSENEVEEVTSAPKEQKKPKTDAMPVKGKGGQNAGIVKKQASLLTFFKKN